MRLSLLLPWVGAWAIAMAAHGIAASAEAPAAPAARLVLDLSDGSRIIGRAAIDRLTVATDYANMEIPLSVLHTIEFSGTSQAAHVNLGNGNLVSGTLAATEIAVKTAFGQVKIPMAKVLRIRVSGGNVKGKPMPDGLVLHYTFDADEGERVTDMSDAGNNGKVHGATYTSEGKVGGAMSFNGDHVAVTVGNPASLQLQDFTITAWIKRGDMNMVTAPNGISGNAMLFGYGIQGYALGMFPSGSLFLTKTDVSNVGSSVGIHDDAFHHVAVTKHGSKIVFYLDGAAFPAPDYDPGFEFNNDACVGGRSDNFTCSFLGVIDEVAVFSRVLSDDEVKGIYDSQK